MPEASFSAIHQVLRRSSDSADLLQQAVFLVEELEQQYPEAASILTGIDTALKALALLPRATDGDYDAVISETQRIIQNVNGLSLVTEELQLLLSRYLWILEARQRGA